MGTRHRNSWLSEFRYLMGTLIRDGLWLGGLEDACNTSLLHKQGISHILTIEFRPLPFNHQKDFQYKYIHAVDMPDQDLLSYFQECFEFIDDALKTRNEQKRESEKTEVKDCGGKCEEDEGGGEESNGETKDGRKDQKNEQNGESQMRTQYEVNHDSQQHQHHHHQQQESQQRGILVHCYVGCSRSATVVIAYLMMKEQLSFPSALESVLPLRPVCPNPGFEDQLRLFEAMNWRVDKGHPDFRAFCLNNITGKFRELSFVRSSSSSPEDMNISNAMAVDPMGQHNAQSRLLKCRKCRRPLARASSVMAHGRGKTKAPATPPPDGAGDVREKDEPQCTMGLFIEPVEWMKDDILVLEGKLACPKCKAKVGTFSWVGQSCPCGRWIVPAFHLASSKVDNG